MEFFKEKRTGLSHQTNKQMTLKPEMELYVSSSRSTRVKLNVPNEGPFPKPLKWIDVVMRTNTTLDVLLETHIGDYKNVDCDRELSGPWTGFTQVTTLSEKPPNGFTWSGGRVTKVQATHRPDYVCARRMVKSVEKRPTDRNSIRLLKSQTSIKLEG